MKKKIIILLFIFWLSIPDCVYASNTQNGIVQESDTRMSDTGLLEMQQEAQEELFSQFDFGEMDSFLEEQFPDEKLSFLDMIKQLISGEMEFSIEDITDMILEQFFYEFTNTKASIVHILAVVIIAAVFHNFSGVFKESQVSEIGFFVLYMLLITISLHSFQGLMAAAVSGLNDLLDFLQLLGPIYFLAVAIATGSATSIAFYQMILLLISVVELIIQGVLIPLVQIYMIVRIINELSQESYLTKLGELLRTVIVWGLRTLLGSVIGINLIQGLLNPAIDSVKRSVLTRGGEAIPIIGDVIGGATEVVLGTAVLIKNGIGIAGAIICIVICMSPVIQMAVVTFMYKLTAALVQPISDKRVIGCISSMADGTEILLKILFTSGMLFLITIAMVANTTS